MRWALYIDRLAASSWPHAHHGRVVTSAPWGPKAARAPTFSPGLRADPRKGEAQVTHVSLFVHFVTTEGRSVPRSKYSDRRRQAESGHSVSVHRTNLPISKACGSAFRPHPNLTACGRLSSRHCAPGRRHHHWAIDSITPPGSPCFHSCESKPLSPPGAGPCHLLHGAPSLSPAPLVSFLSSNLPAHATAGPLLVLLPQLGAKAVPWPFPGTAARLPPPTSSGHLRALPPQKCTAPHPQPPPSAPSVCPFTVHCSTDYAQRAF